MRALGLFGLLGKEAGAARAAELAPNVIKEQENAALARVSTQLLEQFSILNNMRGPLSDGLLGRDQGHDCLVHRRTVAEVQAIAAGINR